MRWVGFKTIVIREYGRIIRIWGQTIVPSASPSVLYFAIFGSLIGRRVGAMGGFDYKQFIAPGLIMMSVITNSYGNVVASFFGAKFGKHVEELLVSPLPNWVIVGGYAVGGVVRGLLVGAAVTVVSLVFTHLHVHHLLVVLTALLLTSVTFALGGLPQCAVREELRPGELDSGLRAHAAHLLRRRVLLGEPAAGLGARAVATSNPILYMVNAFRYGFLGVSDVHVGAGLRAHGGWRRWCCSAPPCCS